MADPKFADAVARRFKGGGGGKRGAEGSAAEETTEPGGEALDEGDSYDKSAAEKGRMLIAAIKRGDGAAACEAVRAIQSE